MMGLPDYLILLFGSLLMTYLMVTKERRTLKRYFLAAASTCFVGWMVGNLLPKHIFLSYMDMGAMMALNAVMLPPPVADASMPLEFPKLYYAVRVTVAVIAGWAAWTILVLLSLLGI